MDFDYKKATNADSHFFWELANDPMVRVVSFSSEPIPWEVHNKWFEKKILEPETLLLTVRNSKDENIGQLRFEKKKEGYVISVSVVKEYRGKGIGSEIIIAGSKRLFQTFPEADKINAYIKHKNRASIRSFEKAGYATAGFATINEKDDAVLMVNKK